jgi:hypothetical protein
MSSARSDDRGYPIFVAADVSRRSVRVESLPCGEHPEATPRHIEVRCGPDNELSAV